MHDRARRSVPVVPHSPLHRGRRTAALALAMLGSSVAVGTRALAQAVRAARAAGAHTIAGSVRAADESRLFGAHVALTAAGAPAQHADAVTDVDGAFRFDAVPDGEAVLLVHRLGFRPETLSVEVPQPEGGPIVVMLARVAQPLAPVLVRETARSRPLGSAFDRRRTGGFGHFVTRADIERERPQRTSDLFRTIPGVTLAVGASGSLQPIFRTAGRADRCSPAYWLDGLPLGNGTPDLDAIDPRSIEGIEVYSGNATVPPALHQTVVAGGCGVIAIWTRRGEARLEDVPDPVAADSLDAMVARGWAYTADQVEMPAMPLPGFAPAPAYPDSLRAANVRGRVVAEFIVDAQGKVDPETIGIVSSTNPLFTRAVREALMDARFSPAYRDHQVVRQVVQLPVVFEPPAASPGGLGRASP